MHNILARTITTRHRSAAQKDARNTPLSLSMHPHSGQGMWRIAIPIPLRITLGTPECSNIKTMVSFQECNFPFCDIQEECRFCVYLFLDNALHRKRPLHGNFLLTLLLMSSSHCKYEQDICNKRDSFPLSCSLFNYNKLKSACNPTYCKCLTFQLFLDVIRL